MKYTIEQISDILHIPPAAKNNNQVISMLLTDSRKLSHPEKTLFVAIKTNRQDGHLYIDELYQKGVRAFLINNTFDTAPYPEASFLKVFSPLEGLQKIVRDWRNRFSIPVLGITGSNGKTTVKEWLFQLLKTKYNIVRSPKSFNSQIGVPLSLAEMDTSHHMAIFEAGISQTGEMENLQKMIQPDVGIFTNIGEAHAEGFPTKKEKIREKLKLFEDSKLLIFCEDDLLLKREIFAFKKTQNKSADSSLTLFSWSIQQSSTTQLTINQIKKVKTPDNQYQTSIVAKYRGQDLFIQIPFSDDGSIENAIHCWCVLLYLGIDNKTITRRMKQLQPVAMRLEMKPGSHDCILINDSYNSDFTSIKVALDFLFQQSQKSKHSFILSDIEQSATFDERLYQHIANLVTVKKIDRFIGIGPRLCKYQSLFKALPDTTFYSSTADFVASLRHPTSYPKGNFTFQNEIILIKGARSFAFEKINKLLEQKKHQTKLIVNLNAVVHNLKTYQSLLNPGVKTMVMVKAFSYGSGSAEIAGLLQFHRVDYLAVANIDEGIYLRKNGITQPILVLNPDPFYFEELIHWNLEPEIYSSSILKSFWEKTSSLGVTRYPIHLKLDTGMHRLGFMKEDLPELLSFLKSHQGLKIASIFSHLAASENPDMDTFTKKQSILFEKMSDQISSILPHPVIRHLANSSGISRHPQLQYDMVRLGIGLYGIDSAIRPKLEVVHCLKATISQIKIVKRGETIGYGRGDKLTDSKRIAVVALGYADGYLRSLGLGKGQMRLNGQWAPTIGQVCMDMLMLDITHIPEAEEGDYVTVFGSKPRIEAVAKQGKTIPYEILSGLSQRIIRVYTQE